VGIDRPDDADVPSDEHSDHPADRADASATGDGQVGRAPAETRFREEYDADLRAAEAKERAEPAENGQQAGSWEETAEQARWMWTEYKRRWPPEERPPIDRSKDSPGSWHGDGDRVLDQSVNERIEAECDLIAEREEKRITPALRAVETQDPTRRLVGFEHCRKERDRIKEKVYDNMKALVISADEALSTVPDAIRYTFQYEEEAHYTRDVGADITRLRDQGSRLEKLTNYWSDDQYKGINSQWIDLDTGQRFEVQFHTPISHEAKQLTHAAYERLRSEPKPDDLEQMVLEAFQRKVTAEVPVPPGAADIPDYPKRGTDAR
jgi:hypothetical protein